MHAAQALQLVILMAVAMEQLVSMAQRSEPPWLAAPMQMDQLNTAGDWGVAAGFGVGDGQGAALVHIWKKTCFAPDFKSSTKVFDILTNTS